MNYNLISFEGESPFEVSLNLKTDQQYLTLTYKVSGDIDSLSLPPIEGNPSRRIGLWETTCFEFFIKNSSSDDYFEFNFSPSTQWNVFIFHQIRGPLAEWETNEAPLFSLNDSPDSLQYEVKLPWSLFPEGFIEERMMLFSPTTILNLNNGQKYHFANIHPDGKLDFHRYESFTEKL